MKHIFLTLIAILSFTACSSDDETNTQPAKSTYEIDVDIRFEQSGYTLDLSYINDGNQDKIRFENGNEKRITDTNIKDAERIIGIYLNTFRTIPTNSIRVIIRNLDNNEIVLNENITTPIKFGGDEYLYLYYSIQNNEVKALFTEISNFE